MVEDALERELSAWIEALGFELVELERGGSRTRPVLRVRMDRPGAAPGQGVTLDDCAAVSRALEPMLDARDNLGENYALEVSSPGVERPLVKPHDFERFAGHEVALIGQAPLAGRSRRLEGELLGYAANDGDRVRLRLEDGDVVDIPRDEVARAHLVFRWRDPK